MSTNCRLLHDWGKWEFVEQVPAYANGRHVGVVTKQFRTCGRCGYTQTQLDVEEA